MSKGLVRAPKDLVDIQLNKNELKLKGLTVIESCTRTERKQGSLFLEDHFLLFVLRGKYTIHYGDQVYTVHSGEIVLLKKAIVIQYEKSGDAEVDYRLEYMAFFLKDELLNDFVKMANIAFTQPTETTPISIMPVNERLYTYVESLKPYFDEPDGIKEDLVKLKLMELLFDLAHANDNMMKQLLQMKQQVRSNISNVVEENVMNPVNLNELAYLSGRSLSSFKRDFQKIYNTSPSQWIRNRRIDKAKELLSHSLMSVTDVCYVIGFDNVTHFSRVFKEKVGVSPSAYKKQLM